MGKNFLFWLDRHILKIGIGVLLAFIPLYPKFPLFDIKHTWVYIRIEDLVVTAIIVIWLLQLLRKRVSFKTPLTIPIFAYWLVGGISLLFSLFFLKDQLANFFPNVAILHYLRRIEYMLPFFIAASTIKNLKDVKHYLLIISLTLLGVIFYGFGQRYLGFPAILTMNEEFSKGMLLMLAPESRVTSTFAGHYDLAAFLVLMIVFLGSLIFGLQRKVYQLGLFMIVFLAFILLLFTASRISFMVYLMAISFMLYLQQKKWLIVPVVVVSIVLMSVVSGASERFAKTFRVQRVVYSTKTGQPIALLEEPTAPSSTQPPPEENLPLGSGFLTVPALEKTPEATTVATIRRSVVTSLKTATSSSEIATISGDFLIRRTIVYDISFTTRFQGEWPRAWGAFKRNPILGSGFSSISLATDNDYLRALGETGILGLTALLTVFFTTTLVLRRALKQKSPPLEKSILIGVGAGFLSLLLTGTLIDVFEASKVAFPFWMLLGVTLGMVSLKRAKEQSLFKEMVEVVKLPITFFLLFLILSAFLFNGVLNNYFTGDDFTWLRWAVTSGRQDILNFFLWADGFFYRPLAKTYFTLVYPFLGLKPFGYHLVDFFLHFGSAVAVYLITFFLIKRKLVAFLTGLFFLLHPINAESTLWIASTSASMAVFFYVWSFLLFLWWRNHKEWWKFIFFIFSVTLFTAGIFSHEVALTLPLVIFFSDSIFTKNLKNWFLRLAPLLPYFAVFDVYLWLRVGAGAHGFTGDYSYNFKNFIFNFTGNLWGYLGVLVAGENFIPIYDLGRSALRLHKLWASGAILAVLILILAFWLWQKSQVKNWLRHRSFKFYLFASGWFTISLLPFWGLGNLAERYVHLASFSFALVLALLANLFWEKIHQRNALLAFSATLVLVGTVAGFYGRQMLEVGKNWKVAGETANKILLALPSNYATFPSGTTLYFVDLPIREKRAWIFPVGLEDGLWFIYKDENLKIAKAKNIEEALDLSEKNKPSYVFVFENGELKEAKRE